MTETSLSINTLRGLLLHQANMSTNTSQNMTVCSGFRANKINWSLLDQTSKKNFGPAPLQSPSLLVFWDTLVSTRVATFMEKSWNFWKSEIFWNFWKSHGILTKIAKGHGKVMEF